MLAATATSYALGYDPIGLLMRALGSSTQAEAGQWTVDPDTHDAWYSGDQGVSTQGGDSTKNTGRIWTDKSVYSEDAQLTSQSGEGTFTIENDQDTALVSLSALSSAANISGQTTTTQPLDIVLVLDVSGSMDDDLVEGGWQYSEVYDVDQSETYYVNTGFGNYREVSWREAWSSWEYQRVNGQWQRVEVKHDAGWYYQNWQGDYTQVTPKASAGDWQNDQFYTREYQEQMSKIEALQQAANQFIGEMNEQNQGLDAEDQNRIALVKFASNSTDDIGNDKYYDGYYRQNLNNSQVVTDFTSNASTLTSYVNALDPAGATRADYGMQQAQRVISGDSQYGLDGARTNAKKVVIFFTDGQPTTSDSWSNSVANDAISTAHTLKQSGVDIYSIGVFEEANPDDTSGNFNAYMHAVSSNYPNATSYRNLGDRAQDSNYYMAASSATELNDIFEQISEEITGSAATSPIETTDQIGGQNVGYLTFTDTLGDYVEVKNLKSIVFAGQQFNYTGDQPSADGSGSHEYHFTAETVEGGNATVDGNDVYPGTHNLGDITITVQKSDDLQTGDIVTVKIPSSLVPLRLYTASSVTENGETTITTSVRDAYPIRVFYTVGLKSDVMDGDNIDASKLSASYISSHTDDNGNVYFLSNDYSSGSAGTTTATFQPADTNSFYYFTEDTPIYTAEDTDSPATSYTPGNTYYYQRTFYADNQLQPEWVSFTAQDGQLNNYVRRDWETGTYYIEKGSPRLTRPSEFEAAKSDNTTATATDAISPNWAGSGVTVSLGNNGKIAYPVSGSLQISKTVDWGNTGAEHNDKDFTYTVDFGGTGTTVSGSFDYVKYNAAGQPLDASGNVQQVESGAQPDATGQITDGGTLTLKNGEHVVVSGLPANTSFTVTETDAAGYTASNTVDGTASQNGTVAEGAIASNKTVAVAYANTYSVTSADLAAGSINGTKKLTGRDWKDNESFTFTLKPAASSEGAPLPEGAQDGVASVTLTNGNGNDYAEDQEVAFQFGSIQYDRVGTYVYLVQETEGNEYGLAYSNAVYRVTVKVTDDGAGHLSASIDSMYRTFNDNADSTGEDESEWLSVDTAAFVNAFGGEDVDYANITGTKEFTDATSGSKLDFNDFYFNLTAVTAGAPMPDETRTGNLGTGAIEFSDIEFGIDDVGKTYEYQVTEDIPQEALEYGTRDEAAQTVTYQGMTYDTSTKTVTIAVTQDQGTGSVIATVTGNGFEFNNSYQASSVTTESVSDTLKITKKLDGSAGTDGQFTFTMEAADKDTSDAIANGWVTGIDADGNTLSTSAIQKDGSQDIQFDNLTFTRPGTYTFKVTEKQDAPNTAWTYDNHTYQVTFEVKDVDGQLTITSPVTTAGSSTFTNVYKSSMNYDKEAGGIWFSKTLNGRDLTASQFEFTVTTPEGDADSAAKLAEATTALSNAQGANDGTAAMWKGIGNLTFDQDDAGKTFTFIVAETDEHQEGDGYTYDGQPVTVQIAVSDDGDGTMSTVTTVTKDGASATYNSADFKTNDASTYPTASFVNGYQASAADPASVCFEKQLTGRDWKQTDSFEFTLTPNTDRSTVSEDDLEAAMPQDTTAKVTGADEDKGFSFGSFTFSKAGTYAYDVAETQPAEGTDTQGVSYSTDTARVTFTVTDNGTGKLQVTSSITGVTLTDDGAGIFTNTYEATPARLEKDTDTGIGVQKTVTGASNTEDFSFTATFNADDEKNTGSADNIEGLTDGKLTAAIAEDFAAGDTKSADFGTVTFKAPGTYVFDVTEDNKTPDPANGWTYDGSTYQIVVTVNDNTEGELVASVEGNDPTFTNKYEHGTVTLSGDSALKVQKTVTGAPTDVDFDFTATFDADASAAVEDNPGTIAGIQGATEDQGFVLNATVSDSFAEGDAAKTASFGEVTFTQPGTYIFNVVKTNAAPAEGSGWTYDGTTKTITVTVTDNGEGALETKVDYNNDVEGAADADKTVKDAAAFTNVYKAGSVVVGGEDAEQQINVQKTLTGRDWQEGDSFEFVLTAQDNAPMPEGDGNKATITDASDSKTVSFGAITYDTEGTYTYTVSETTGSLGGVTYDNHIATVTVSVTDTDHDGKLDATVSYDNDAATTEDDKEVTNAAAFTNTYDAGETTVDTGSANVQLTKVLEGKAWGEDDAFTFKIEAVSNTADIDTADQPMPEKTQITVSEPTDKDANSAIFSFGTIKYDTAGTYVYKVTEVPGDNPGMDYSKNEATVTVTVTDNLSGGYNTGVTIENSTFINTYASELDFAAAGGIEIVKTFENADMREFSFTVTPADQKSAKKLGIDENGETLTTKSGATIGDDNASHAEVMLIDAATEAKFTQDDADDTYTYKVQEVKGDSADVDYDDTVYTVEITTADDGRGGIKVTTTVTDGAGYSESYTYDNDEDTVDPTAVIPFTNTYKASGELGGNGSVSINATKTLTNRPMGDKEFTFNVTNANDDSKTVVATGSNDASGKITFSAIDYSIDQMLDDIDNGLAAPTTVGDKDAFVYTYQVTEDTTNLDDGVAAVDAAGFTITVTVVDNGDGTLDISVAYPNDADGITFRNTYGETGKATLGVNGTKTLNVASGDNAPDIAGKYEFTLTGSEGAPMPATTTAKNDASGNVSFGDITYTMEDVFGDTGVQATDEDAAEATDETAGAEAEVDTQSAQRTKTFTYTVTESGSVAGVTNDAEASKSFTVTVTDNGDGTLSVASDPASGALFSFTNTYSVESTTSSPTGSGAVTITKQLTGRDLVEGEFAAVMTTANGAEVASGTNDANGTINLSAIEFDAPGSYTYDLYEAVGDKGGVTYDRTQYKATATVTDNGDGTLSVAWDITTAAGDPITDITFANTYEAQSTSVTFGGIKLLDGRELADGEFSFALADADGNTIQTVANDAQGGFTFAPITYDEAGTYEYSISEVASDEAGVTYDSATYEVRVTVTDNGQGRLEVSGLTYNDKAELPVFTNTYTAPAPGTSDTGSTGGKLMQTDDQSLTYVAAAAGVGVVCVAIGLFAHKKRGE